eukprot:TRINITY_DN23447_c0_g1_i1.p1 TRINITY_DN23447_c0_g1~~TRINITY_DN23447_c0_g1_i1.p1  ORF type:complete len:390 (+),score=125.70 TRINITY_DN23447_c0_g1_i1:849-2018(+)
MEPAGETKGKWVSGLQKVKDMGVQGGTKAKNAASKVSAGFEKFEGFEKLTSAPPGAQSQGGDNGGFEKFARSITAGKEKLAAERDRISAAALSKTAQLKDENRDFEKLGKSLAETREKLSSGMQSKKEALGAKVPELSLQAVAEKVGKVKEAVVPQPAPQPEADGAGETADHSKAEDVLVKAKTQGVAKLKEGFGKLKQLLPSQDHEDDDDEDYGRQHSTSMAPAPQRSPSPLYPPKELPQTSDDSCDEELESTAVQCVPERTTEDPPHGDSVVQARRRTIPMLEATLFAEKMCDEEPLKHDSDDEFQISGLTPLCKNASRAGNHPSGSSSSASPTHYAATNTLLRLLEEWDGRQLQPIRDATQELKSLRAALELRNERTENRLRAYRH